MSTDPQTAAADTPAALVPDRDPADALADAYLRHALAPPLPALVPPGQPAGTEPATGPGTADVPEPAPDAAEAPQDLPGPAEDGPLPPAGTEPETGPGSTEEAEPCLPLEREALETGTMIPGPGPSSERDIEPAQDAVPPKHGLQRLAGRVLTGLQRVAELTGSDQAAALFAGRQPAAPSEAFWPDLWAKFDAIEESDIRDERDDARRVAEWYEAARMHTFVPQPGIASVPS